MQVMQSFKMSFSHSKVTKPKSQLQAVSLSRRWENCESGHVNAITKTLGVKLIQFGWAEYLIVGMLWWSASVWYLLRNVVPESDHSWHTEGNTCKGCCCSTPRKTQSESQCLLRHQVKSHPKHGSQNMLKKTTTTTVNQIRVTLMCINNLEIYPICGARTLWGIMGWLPNPGNPVWDAGPASVWRRQGETEGDSNFPFASDMLGMIW